MVKGETITITEMELETETETGTEIKTEKEGEAEATESRRCCYCCALLKRCRKESINCSTNVSTGTLY